MPGQRWEGRTLRTFGRAFTGSMPCCDPHVEFFRQPFSRRRWVKSGLIIHLCALWSLRVPADVVRRFTHSWSVVFVTALKHWNKQNLPSHSFTWADKSERLLSHVLPFRLIHVFVGSLVFLLMLLKSHNSHIMINLTRLAPLASRLVTFQQLITHPSVRLRMLGLQWWAVGLGWACLRAVVRRALCCWGG